MTLPPCPMCRRWESDAELRIAELDHSYVILNRDQFFPGYTLLFSKTHVTELFHLDRRVRGELMEEVSRTARALFDVFRPDKINYELLGNMVPHMHWHLVPRFAKDMVWPRPIWAEPHDESFPTAEEYRRTIAQIQEALT
jgi:diadenosine tetraphosphate (Ap4A) HIT family hydrolase